MGKPKQTPKPKPQQQQQQQQPSPPPPPQVDQRLLGTECKGGDNTVTQQYLPTIEQK